MIPLYRRDRSNGVPTPGRPAITTTEIVQNQLNVREIAPHEHHLVESSARMTANAVRG